ncbi:MAG: hypothetical protein RRB13_08105 [bacterium]|nr:hypothetical protein [bacterium]
MEIIDYNFAGKPLIIDQTDVYLGEAWPSDKYAQWVRTEEARGDKEYLARIFHLLWGFGHAILDRKQKVEIEVYSLVSEDLKHLISFPNLAKLKGLNVLGSLPSVGFAEVKKQFKSRETQTGFIYKFHRIEIFIGVDEKGVTFPAQPAAVVKPNDLWSWFEEKRLSRLY